jgi:hypothetical protein
MDIRKAKRDLARARRTAEALTRGEEILECVEENKDLLIEGADEGVPPVSKIGRTLYDQFGEDVKHLPVRQWVGTLTRALLALEGYEVDETGVRVKDPVFKSGSTYRRVETEADTDFDAVLEPTFRRMVEALTISEQRMLLKVLKEELA